MRRPELPKSAVATSDIEPVSMIVSSRMSLSEADSTGLVFKAPSWLREEDYPCRFLRAKKWRLPSQRRQAPSSFAEGMGFDGNFPG